MLNPASEAFETALRAALPAAAFRPLEPRYLEEPRGRYKAEDALLVAPGTVDEVARLIGLANEMGVGVIPYGGGTGLVGGQTMEHGPKPVLLSMERMSAPAPVRVATSAPRWPTPPTSRASPARRRSRTSSSTAGRTPTS